MGKPKHLFDNVIIVNNDENLATSVREMFKQTLADESYNK